jgi:hypothetical protein
MIINLTVDKMSKKTPTEAANGWADTLMMPHSFGHHHYAAGASVHAVDLLIVVVR